MRKTTSPRDNPQEGDGSQGAKPFPIEAARRKKAAKVAPDTASPANDAPPAVDLEPQVADEAAAVLAEMNRLLAESGQPAREKLCDCTACGVCFGQRALRAGDLDAARMMLAPTTLDPDDAPPPPPGIVRERNELDAEALLRATATDAAREIARDERARSGRAVLAFTDVGNAERLVRDHNTDLRYCPEWESWVTWDGRRWVPDVTGEAFRRAKITIRGIPAECAHFDGDAWKAAMKHALASESAKHINAMVQLARWYGTPVRAEAFDADPWALNCLNGTVDLRTGELRPHDRENLCTKLAPVEYDPDARSEVWERFLSEALDGHTPAGAEVIDYVRRAVGYTLTGDTREEVLFFVYGKGGGGKSTFLESVRAVLGDYATMARFELFIKKTGDAPTATPDVARLRGARFVGSIETEEHKRLSEGTVKSLTGGDVVTARELYQRAFEFKPTFKLWLAANDAPRVNDQDDALFRRMRRVSFPRERNGEGQRDTSIKTALTNPKVSGPAILAWAVQGCLAWQRDGLKTPAAVLASTEAYRAENDPLAEFFADRAEFNPHAKVARKALRAAYEAWVRECGSGTGLAPKRFAERVRARLAKEHGATHETETTVRFGGAVCDGWRGVELRQIADDHHAVDGARERIDLQ